MPIQLGTAHGKIEIDTSSVALTGKSVAAAMGAVQQATLGMGKSISLVARDAKELEQSLKPVGVALSVVSAAGGALITTSTMTAARTQELSYAMAAVGKNARAMALEEGDAARANQFTTESLNKNVEAIKAKGITTQVAMGLTTQFARYQLDLAKATDLARVSQDAAVLSMENSSQNLDGLMYGIITYNQRILRTHGINVDLSKAFDVLAESLGKTADDLTEAEKVSATLNAVLKEGGRIAGTYEAAMDAAGKRLRSLDRYWEEARNNLGKAFLPAMNNLVDTATNVLKAFNNLAPAQQEFAAGALTVTTAVTGVAGGFILLAPRILQTAAAMKSFVMLSRDVATGLQLMHPVLFSLKGGLSAAEVASTGFAGSVAVAIPVVLALAAALYAAYRAYELNQEIQAKTIEVGDAMTRHLREQAEAGKSAEEIMTEYVATQKRINDVYEAGGVVAKVFIDKQKLLQGGLAEYAKVLAETNISQEQYEAEMRRAAEAVGLLIDADGNLVDATDRGIYASTRMVQAHILQSASARDVAKMIKETANEITEFRYAQQWAGETVKKTTEQLKKEQEEADKLRDATAKLADSALTVAEQFAGSNSKLDERADLERQLADLNKEIAKNGPVRVEVEKKLEWTSERIAAAQAKRRAIEEDIATAQRKVADVQRKKGESDKTYEARVASMSETDREYAARVADLKADYADLSLQIQQATGAVDAHKKVVGGVTKEQQNERKAILDKIAAIDEEMRKELSRQAVESLTPEMFEEQVKAEGKITDASKIAEEAVKRYETAKRGLMLATGMVTKESLAEKDAIGLLTDALAKGQITPDQYAIALQKVRDAAADGVVSLRELTRTVPSLSGTKFALKNIDVKPATKTLKTEAVQTGKDLVDGVAQGITLNASAVATSLDKAVSDALSYVRGRYRMRSPSLVMAGAGHDLAAGLTVGIQAETARVQAAMANLLSVKTPSIPTWAMQPAVAAESMRAGQSAHISLDANYRFSGNATGMDWNRMEAIAAMQVSQLRRELELALREVGR